MANETAYSDNITLAAALDARIVPMFTSASIMAGLVEKFAADPNSKVRDLPKSGTITASVVAEGVAVTPQTLTDTKATLTMQKAVVATKPTAESLRFAQNGTNFERHARLHAQACSKKFDVDALALANGFSQAVDAGATMTVAKLQEAAYKVRAGNMPSSVLAAVLHYKQMYELEAAIAVGGNAIYGNPNFNLGAAVDATRQRPGYKGQVFGVDLFESGDVYVATAPTPDDYIGMVICPQYAIAALFPDGSGPGFESELDGSVGFLESVKHIKTVMWYGLIEYVDTAGVGLASDIS